MRVQREATRATGKPGGEAGWMLFVLVAKEVVVVAGAGVVDATGLAIVATVDDVSMGGRVIDAVDRMIVLKYAADSQYSFALIPHIISTYFW